MTHVNNAPWFTKAGAATSIVPLSHFVGASIFALKAADTGACSLWKASIPRAAPTRI